MERTLRRRSLPLLVLTLTAVGCMKSCDNVESKHVDSQAMHQSYVATYSAEGDSVQLFARLRVGGPTGTNVILSPPSEISGDGQPLAAKDGMLVAGTLPGRYYERTVGGFQQDHEFVFTGTGGRQYRNGTRIERADFTPDQPTTLRRTTSHTIRFGGPPLRAGEVVHLRVDAEGEGTANPPEGKSITVTASSSRAGADTVTLSASDLSRLVGTRGRMQLQRTWSQPLQQGGEPGGTVEATYFSKWLAVRLSE